MTPLVLATSFIATNIDGFAVLALLFVLNPPTNHRRVVISACAGFAAILAISVTAAFTIHAIAPGWVRWLGLLLVIGGTIRACVWFATKRAPGKSSQASASVLTAVLLTGGDNVAVYVGLFANLAAVTVGLTSAAYLIAFGTLTYGLLLLVSKGKIARLPGIYAEPVAALVLIVVGIAVTAKVLLA